MKGEVEFNNFIDDDDDEDLFWGGWPKFSNPN